VTKKKKNFRFLKEVLCHLVYFRKEQFLSSAARKTRAFSKVPCVN
jgi:hypothetical protein